MLVSHRLLVDISFEIVLMCIEIIILMRQQKIVADNMLTFYPFQSWRLFAESIENTKGEFGLSHSGNLIGIAVFR